MPAVTFRYDLWQFRYPEIAAFVPQGMATAYFEEACLYLDNSDRSAVRHVGRRSVILGMITAHIAALNAPLGDGESSPLVGRISSATEGSVSVQTTMQIPGTAEWFMQSKYGAAAFQAMAAYRTARYIPGGHSHAMRRW